MKTPDETDSTADCTTPTDMHRRQLRHRSAFFLLLRYKVTRYLSLFIGSCLISFTIFIFLVYSNSNVFVDFLVGDGSEPEDRLDPSPEAARRHYRSKWYLGKERSLRLDEVVTYQDFNYLKPETLTYVNKTFSNNIRILYRMPQKVKPWALLLIFHGCSRWANDWFHTTERQRIIGAAIDLGFGCLAFQSTNLWDRCWSSETDIYENEDVQMVLKGLEGFYKEHPKLESLSRFTFGASSGGVFSSLFVINQRYPVKGQIVFIAIVHPQILATHVKADTYPATVWIYMPRDIEFASEERINISIGTFVEQNIPYKRFVIEPIRLQPSTFSQRIPTLTDEASSYIFYKFQRHQWLNSNQFLIHNPRRDTGWEEFLFKQPKTNKSPNYATVQLLIKHRTIISEFLNTVYGEHEISYERSYEALSWFKKTFEGKTDTPKIITTTKKS